jgi:endonuclease/exonuclease/phosphatase (EEP) superfamily protein YafD
VTLLFWNVNGRRLEHLIAALIQEHNVDIVLLAENRTALADLLVAVNKEATATYSPPTSFSDKVQILSRLPEGSIRPIRDYGGVTLRHVSPPIGQDILLVAAHLPSKLFRVAEDQTAYCCRVARMIDEAESRLGHSRTVLVGDLNMNPFERGMASADAFHGLMSRSLLRSGSRRVDGMERRFFYNPMWTRFGDHALGPPGTYFYEGGGHMAYFWNIFDQVLIRFELLACFDDQDVKVLTRAGDTNLLNRTGVPDVSIGSDHLPLLFKLNLNRNL